MAQASPVVDEIRIQSHAPVRFTSLLLEGHAPVAGRKSVTLGVSVVFHAALAIAMVVGPLLYNDVLPSPPVLKAFFVTPLELAPAPPPPPPPAAGPRVTARLEPRPQTVESAFVAPIEVPERILPEESLDLGVEGGMPGGVEGGVPGGVVGGIVGGLPDAPPPPPKVVRIGGKILAPRIVRRVDPAYPEVAAGARIKATVVVEAQVDTAGHVQTTKVVQGHPLFDESAVTALKQWRYQPLLLNGEPTAFIIIVTFSYNLRPAGA
jgi:protein TonB